MLTLISIPLIVAAEVFYFRTGIFRTAQYWLALAIIAFFQVLVDGWLTKLSDPIVIYNPAHHSGMRFPWDIPIEDFGFGWGMLTLTMLMWVHLGRRRSGSRDGRA